MKVLLFFILLMLHKTNQIITFEKFVGGHDSYGMSIIQLEDESYVFLGYTPSFGAGNIDAYIGKLDKNGNLLWQKTLGGINVEKGEQIQQTKDDGFVIVGYTSSYGAGGYDALIAKLDKYGGIIWAKALGGKYDDYVKSITETTDGSFIFAGRTKSFVSHSYEGILFGKINKNGDFLWVKTIGGKTIYDLGRAIIKTKDGNYVMMGVTFSFGAGGADNFILKFDTNGNIIWSKTLGSEHHEYGVNINETKDEGFILVGRYQLESGLIARLDKYGNFLWVKSMERGFSASICENKNGDFILTGWNIDEGILIAKLNKDGNLLWAKALKGGQGFQIRETKDGGMIMIGFSYNKIIIVKLDDGGNLEGEAPLKPKQFYPVFKSIISIIKNRFANMTTTAVTLKSSAIQLTICSSLTSLTLKNKTDIPQNTLNHIAGKFQAYSYGANEKTLKYYYHFISGEGSDDNGKFYIDSSGQLKNKIALNFTIQQLLYIRVRANGTGRFYFDKNFTIKVKANEAPSSVYLKYQKETPENNTNFIVGLLQTQDPNEQDKHTYAFVLGEGSEDNAKFYIDFLGQLRTKIGLNYAEKRNCFIRVRTTDQNGLYYEKSFIINVKRANKAPISLFLKNQTDVPENIVGFTIGYFQTLDPDANNLHTYSFVVGDGSDDNSKFSLNSKTGELKNIVKLNYKRKKTYHIRVKTTDQNGLFYEKAFVIKAKEYSSNSLNSSNLFENLSQNIKSLNTKINKNTTLIIAIFAIIFVFIGFICCIFGYLIYKNYMKIARITRKEAEKSIFSQYQQILGSKEVISKESIILEPNLEIYELARIKSELFNLDNSEETIKKYLNNLSEEQIRSDKDIQNYIRAWIERTGGKQSILRKSNIVDQNILITFEKAIKEN